MQLEGKKALVTGGGVGIGKECALELARRGADVVLSYYSDREGAEEAVADIKAMGRQGHALAADLGDVEECFKLVDAAVERLGGLDILINNAGRTDEAPFDEVTPEDFDELYAINVRGQFFVAQRAVRSMRERGGGAIVNMSSVQGLQGTRDHSVYQGTKGAAISFTRAIAVELGKYKIRVNAVAPGLIEVPRHHESSDYDPEERASRIPWGDVGHPPDVAHTCAWLVSDEAIYITGAVIVVDGGVTAQLSLDACG